MTCYNCKECNIEYCHVGPVTSDGIKCTYCGKRLD